MKVRILQDEEEHGWGLWEDCIGIIDGTFIPFARWPFLQNRAVYF